LYGHPTQSPHGFSMIADLMLFEKIQQFFEIGTRKHLYRESGSSHAVFPILPQKWHNHPGTVRNEYRMFFSLADCTLTSFTEKLSSMRRLSLFILLLSVHVIQYLPDPGFQRGNILFDRLPHEEIVYSEVSMDQPVPHTRHIFPGDVGSMCLQASRISCRNSR